MHVFFQIKYLMDLELELTVVQQFDRSLMIKNFIDPDRSRPYVLLINDPIDLDLVSPRFKSWPPVLVVFDGVIFYEKFPWKYHWLPIWLDRVNQSLISDPDYALDTEVCFNFCINRMTDARFLTIKLIEWFDLKCSNYTWSGGKRIVDASQIIADFPKANFLQDDLQKHILSPIELPSNFIATDTLLSIVPVAGAFEQPDELDPSSRWKLIHKSLFQQSAVSLINEPCAHEPASLFSEKTIYAMLGLTLPIWPGGYRMAESWKLMGFDTFDDIIDHSYQHHDTLLERVYFAIKNNLQLLTDLELATRLRNKHIDRLILNHKRLRYAIGECLQTQISLLPPNVFNLLQNHGVVH